MDKEGKLQPVAYQSETMMPAECNYDIHDQEQLAIGQALDKWKNYAKGNAHQIRILTDHKNLIPFTTTKELNGRQIRWSEKLSQFNLSIEYRPGKQGGKLDALTRRTADLPTPEDNRKTHRQ